MSAPKGPTLISQYTQNPSTRAYHFVEKRMSDFKRWDSAPEFSRDWDRQTFANVGSAVAPDAVASGEVGGFGGWLDNIQLGLDVAGMTPGLGAAADATNAVIHLARGNWAGAALSSIAIIPLIGDAAVLAKMADRAGDVAKSEAKVVWPPNRGFDGDAAPATLIPGAKIDRYGSPNGTFVAPDGTPFPMRSLPESSAAKPLNTYEVLKPIEVNAGPAAPWFNQPGGGMQFELPRTVQELIDSGHLR